MTEQSEEMLVNADTQVKDIASAKNRNNGS